MADLKPTMDYKVRVKVNSRTLLGRKLRGGEVAVKKNPTHNIAEKNESFAELKKKKGSVTFAA